MIGEIVSGHPATIYDVAREAGVSPATVSRVLNEPSRVQEEKRKRVMDAIATLSFVPRAAAVAHARSLYKKIGVIAPFFTQPSFMQRLRGISSVLSGNHYEVVVYAIESTLELEEYVDMLSSSRRLDGLVVLCLDMREESVETLRSAGLPVCFVEADAPGFDSVIVENYEGGREAARFLYERGYRRPGFIGEASSRSYAVPATELRLRGFTDFMAERGISLDSRHVWLGEFSEETIERGFDQVLAVNDKPDCFFASSDMIAIRLMRHAAREGLRIPGDLGLVGFDDLDIAEYLNLSTVSQGLDESGRLAAEMILDRLKDPGRPVRKVLAPLRLIERDSAMVPQARPVTGGGSV